MPTAPAPRYLRALQALFAVNDPRLSVTLTAEPEDTRPDYENDDGNPDKEMIDAIMRDLNTGNDWAWCCAHVNVRFAGVEGDAYLGCCSYKSAADFKACSGYYDGMINDALHELAKELDAVDAALAALRPDASPSLPPSPVQG